MRPGNSHASRGAVGLPRRVVGWPRAAWPAVAIEVRADAGFAVPAVYDYCEAAGIGSTLGLVSNPRLEAIATPLLADAETQHAGSGEKVRLVGEDRYQASSWDHDRRLVSKAEAMAEGTNTRCVVTTKPDDPATLYGW